MERREHNQQWRLDPAGEGSYNITNRGTGTALDSFGDITLGSDTRLWAPNSHPNNRYTITAV